MKRNTLMASAVFLLVAVLAVAGGIWGTQRADADSLSTEDLTGALTADDLANTLVGEGISISGVTYSGADIAAGTFSGGTGIIGFESGIILSSGDVANVIGPNVSDSIGTANGTPGDGDLDAASGFTTFDAAVLEFDFVPTGGDVAFQYVFASDEYNEFVNSSFNDVFAFFINGENCAMVNSDPVSVNTINNGNPGGDPTPSHPELYINNDLDDGGGAIDTEMDGLTVVLTCAATVDAGETNHMKLAIADASDEIYDSNVFLQAGSFEVVTTPTSTATPTPCPGVTPEPAAGATVAPPTPMSPPGPMSPPEPTPTPEATATATPCPPEPTASATLEALPATGSSPAPGGGSDDGWLIALSAVAALAAVGSAGYAFLRFRSR